MVKLAVRTAFVIAFSFVAVLFVQSGLETRTRILAAENARYEAHHALEYINYIIRTNDVTGRIETAHLARTSETALIIRHRAAAEDFDRWIHFEDGQLREMHSPPGEQPTGEYIIIAKLYNVQIDYDPARRAVVVQVDYMQGETVSSITRVIGIRSERGDR